MARPARSSKARFTPPQAPQSPNAGRVMNPNEVPQEDLEAPKFAGEGRFLREKKTGHIHVWNESMAQRGDLVEVYDPDSDEQTEQALNHLSNFDASIRPPQGAQL